MSESSELEQPIWSVVDHTGVLAVGQTYDEARAAVETMDSRSATVVTDEVAYVFSRRDRRALGYDAGKVKENEITEKSV